MSARGYVEDVVAALLSAAEGDAAVDFPDGLGLGVPVFPGRTKQTWPPSYVAVVADREEPRSGDGVWLVEATIWSVVDADDDYAVELSHERVRKLARWFGGRCPARGYANAGGVIHGVRVVGGGGSRYGDHSFADVLPVVFGVQVR